jgi:hypothetical protein
MKKLIGVVSVLAFLGAVVPAMAADDVFHALSQLPTQERAALTPLPDDQLASIEGQAVCVTCVAIVGIRQTNVDVRGNALQSNFAAVAVIQGSY